MLEPLTDIERRILDYMVNYLRRNTYQPSIREIGHEFEIKSTKTVAEHLQSIADKGWVERDPSRSRGVRLLTVDLGGEATVVPVFPELSPRGEPLPEDGHVAEYLIDSRLAAVHAPFCLSMQGDGLSADGIHAGDLLLADRLDPAMDPSRAAPGDLLVARIEGRAVIGWVRDRDGEAWLQTPSGAEWPLGEGGAGAIGRVVGVFRRLPPDARPHGAAAAAAGGMEAPTAVSPRPGS